jgi:plasmid maintenance system antidote protein VapI
METFSSILEEIIQKNEQEIKNVGDFANKIDISAASLSRIKSEKASLTDNVIKRIYDYFSGSDKEYADSLKERLEKIKSKADLSTILTGNSAIDEYAKLLKKMSREGNLLIVDYRDFPVSLARFPHIIDLTVEALQSGLCVALFQPFGSREALYKRHNLLGEKSSKLTKPNEYKNADKIVNSYDYLIRLAGEVSNLYGSMKNKLNSEAKGQIVLYEAEYKDAKKNSGALPSIVAGGINSKLYYAQFLDVSGYQTKIYSWISTTNEDFLFIERSNTTLNFNAVKMQYNPIYAYWEQEKKLPETEEELNEANKNFGLKALFDEEDSVKWKICAI